eukprot:TRINITY_DN3053_c0_g4_i2.p3 TRINITY_DN3053_c0_g4~~TRINITY_DN3053_c0_g4_i2.p3  ORF type:complete len:137 (+),score=28.70 TRINITY_DN3053_c0_g4_i2:79-489(+)
MKESGIDLTMNSFIKSVEIIDKHIKVKERPNKHSFEHNIKPLIDSLATFGKRNSEMSLALLLKKCKSIRQGPALIELLYMNGIIDIKKQPILYPAGTFSQDWLDVMDIDNLERVNATSTEYFVEMRGEEFLITSHN